MLLIAFLLSARPLGGDEAATHTESSSYMGVFAGTRLAGGRCIATVAPFSSCSGLSRLTIGAYKPRSFSRHGRDEGRDHPRVLPLKGLDLLCYDWPHRPHDCKHKMDHGGRRGDSKSARRKALGLHSHFPCIPPRTPLASVSK